MPAAVASGVQLGGPPKNKKIVFDDSGEAIAKANKKDASPKEQAKKPTKIKFGDDGEAASKKPFNKSHQNGQKPQKIKFGDDGEAIAQKPFNKSHQNGQKPQRTKFGDDGEAIAQKPFNKSHQKFNGQKAGFEKKPQKIKFNDDGAPQKQFNKNQQQNDRKTFNKNGAKPDQAKKSQKIKFGDDDEATEKSKKPQRIKFDEDGAGKNVSDSEGDSDVELGAVLKKHNKYHSKADEDEASQKKWYNVYPDCPSTDEVLDMKENEQLELFNLCKSSFEAEKNTFNKRNPTDARWLQTALHKGTAKDRANAGALLVTSNPLGNLEALTTLIGFCKLSNKASNDVIAVLTDLWQEVLLPPNRKLLAIHTRGADWKTLKKDDKLHKEQQRRIYAYWYFESELKDQYHEFLKNVMQGLQTGQEHNKNSSIVAAARLLSFAPEKEQMLLTMLVNKLGDPVPKVASKALHHLSEVAQRHPNMCGVIVAEAEKLLFRNNISERAQHFALCFLSSIAPSGRPEVCTKLVNICFALFKVLVQKGAVNNRTMQAILRCLQKAIVEAQPAKDSNGELLNKEMQDTIYRLVHLADIRVSIQTLGLLLQLITVKTEKSDRFYNALYVKLLDLDLVNVGSKTAAHLLHIVHRAIHIDNHVARAQAFIKRLLQITLYAPPHIAAGCLIVLHKLLRMRRELIGGSGASEEVAAGAKVILPTDVYLDKFGSDDEEVYKDVKEEKEAEEDKSEPKEEKDEKSQGSSWHHASVAATESKVREIDSCKYDPYHRVPAFAGAGYALRNELLLLRNHYHPTVQVFAEQILQQARIDYYGDPLRDFGLPHFLERFAFKNPKKLDNSQAAESATVAHKRYIAQGGRGKTVKSLTKANCTEDEMFIFNFLEHKRRQAEIVAQSKKEKGVKKEDPDGDEDAEGDGEYLKEGEVDDDEFEAYLDGYFGKKFKDGGDAEEEDDELNFLEELGGEMQADKSKKDKKKKKSADKEEDDMEDIDDDWGDDDLGEEDDDDEMAVPDEDHSDDETGSIDLEPMDDDDDDDDEGSISDGDTSDMPESPDEEEDDDDLDAPPKSKRSRKDSGSMVDGRSFAKTLKQSHDMSSLFAAADDFSSMLEESSKVKGQGTSNAVFNKDKSSAKQLKWEENRRSNTKTYTGKKFSGKSKAGKAGKPQKGGKKRKH